MQDELVTYETAKLAKQKGFNELVKQAFTEKGKERYTLHRNSWGSNKVLGYSRPTQSLLQRWLREIHNIHVYVHNSIVSNFPKQCTYSILGNGINISYDKVNNDYEKILELGLQSALNLLPDVEL